MEGIAAEPVDPREAFARQFYRWVPPEDLARRSPRDLRGAATAIWDLAQVRTSGCAAVRAYNPEVEKHGWESANTVVEVVTDDTPFLVDSVGMELSRCGYGIRLSIAQVIDAVRDRNGRLTDVQPPDGGVAGAVRESVMQLEVDREREPERLSALIFGVRRVLADVRAAVEDWQPMRERLQEIVAGFESAALPLDRGEGQEVAEFLGWVDHGNFIFLGYREYDLVTEDGEQLLRTVDGSGLGILRGGTAVASQSFARLPSEVRVLARSPDPLILTKANSRSTVHRPLYLDYIGVKRFDGAEVCGERRFLGLYTTAAERANPREIPILRDKVERVIRRAAFAPGGHHDKALVRTLENYPRDELFQISADELFGISMGIVALGERTQVRLFARTDRFRRFVSCLVFVPRDRFNTENRERIAWILREAFGASELDWRVRLSESKLARIHYVLRTGSAAADHDLAEIEQRMARVTRPWSGHLADALRDVYGEERGNALFRRYGAAFPIAYQADWPARTAVTDIERAEALADGKGLVVSVYEGEGGERRCKLVSPGERISLSDVLPIFENMGLQVSDERPYELKPDGPGSIWVYDLGVICDFDVDLRLVATRAAFQNAFAGVWTGELENDRLGALVLRAGLTGREVSLLRALVKYRRQAGTTFSDRYMQQTLTGNPAAARLLIELFEARLDPDRHDTARADRLAGELERATAGLTSRDHARIVRDCLAIVLATVRTNYFQCSAEGHPKTLSLKLDPSLMPSLPLPGPQFETFVYSPRVEGVYVRNGRVARGGIRSSDRREDFRAEALQLMEAETVRNAVIVPAGAAGTFVTKRPPSAEPLEEVANCYELVLSGLLDVTDNVVSGEVVGPQAVIRHDGDDAYLVIGGDERTPALSERANRFAAARGFWLKDSFAADAYDDRELGVVSRGTWESVVRHFRDLDLSASSDELTVVGIGSMSGDAFGNGMLHSPRIKLIGAFDDEHVFLDPRPDPRAGFAERRRLFALPACTWRDYDAAAISEGGGVFARSAELIPLSPQVRAALAVDADALTPNELVQALLRAPVDLLWNGGAGTFVKGESESDAEVGDPGNEGVRIDAPELRCRVVGEAGSGGFTQRARIEYAAAGGRINTAAIDTAAGVNYSDHQLNLRILLDAAVAEREITTTERTGLLATLAEPVAERVVGHSYTQALALSLERRQASALLDLHVRLIGDLARSGFLARQLEDLPDEDRIRELRAAHAGLTAPELAVLLAHAKVALKTELLGSDLPDDEHLRNELADSLPASLRERFRTHMRGHPLRREIIATDLANSIVDRQGTTFVSRLAEESRASVADIARAYAVGVGVFEMREFWREVRALDGVVDQHAQVKLLLEGRRLITRAARWLLHNRGATLGIAAALSDYAQGVRTLWEVLPELQGGLDRDAWQARVAQFTGPGIPGTLAMRVAAMDAMFFAFDVIESVRGTNQSVRRAAAIHFALDRRLELDWLRERILALPRVDIWETLARSAFRDKLYAAHRALTAGVLEASPTSVDGDAAIDAWARASGATVERYLHTVRDIRAARADEFTTLLVAVRELANLTPAKHS